MEGLTRMEEVRMDGDVFRDATPRRCTKPYATVNLHKRLFPGRSFSLGPKQILTGTSSAPPVILKWRVVD